MQVPKHLTHTQGRKHYVNPKPNPMMSTKTWKQKNMYTINLLIHPRQFKVERAQD